MSRKILICVYLIACTFSIQYLLVSKKYYVIIANTQGSVQLYSTLMYKQANLYVYGVSYTIKYFTYIRKNNILHVLWLSKNK